MKNYADLVNPYIGTISHMLKSTIPEVMLPYGMARMTPVVDDCSDYYCNDTVVGYPVGKIHVTPGINEDYKIIIDHSREDFKCYKLFCDVENSDLIVEATATAHCYVYRFSNLTSLKISHENSEVCVKNNMIYVKTTILADMGKIKKNYVQYSVIKTNNTIEVLSQSADATVISACDSLNVIGAVSYVSFDKAVESMEKETNGKDFDTLAMELKEIWNKQLGKIEVEGNTEDKQIIFYTALYRAFQRTTDYTEYGQYFSGYDDSVHEGTFYTGDGLWDTFRGMHPLQLIVDKTRHIDILNSYILMYKHSGLMPSFPYFTGDMPVMLGFHAAALFADGLAKGIDVDYATAYEGLYLNATSQSMMPWCANHPKTIEDECYYNKGFFPALKTGEEETCTAANSFEKRQAIAVTLEHSYDDWCLAQIAKHLGKTDDYNLFMSRSKNYANLYNKELGLMAPKDINGNWLEDFDPYFGGGMGGREFTAENNTFTYTWSVFHDFEGLAEIMGGKECASAKLDKLFTQKLRSDINKFVFLGQFPDSTGLMGQFVMGNEPSFHIPYIYNYLGHPWKTQKKIRELMDIWFTNSPTGICGDEDGGAMSSWFAFSAMGFYPVCPGKGEYAIGAPIFDKITIHQENGKDFVVESKGAANNKYIKSAKINSKEITEYFISHQDLLNGAVLTLEMDNKPNK